MTHAHCDGKFTDTFAAKISDAALQPVLVFHPAEGRRLNWVELRLAYSDP